MQTFDSPHRLTHQNWEIAILPIAQQASWFFKCLPPKCQETLTDGREYLSAEEAIAAAQAFVDRRLAGDGLGRLLDSLVEQEAINSTQYAQALRWLAIVTHL